MITAANGNDGSRAQDKDTYGIRDTHERATMDHREKLGRSRRRYAQRITRSGWLTSVSLSRSSR